MSIAALTCVPAIAAARSHQGSGGPPPGGPHQSGPPHQPGPHHQGGPQPPATSPHPGGQRGREAESRSLDGSDNNRRHPGWGEAGTRYPRVAPPLYGDGTSSMTTGPDPRYVSNRVFNDTGQNLFSENGISQWGWAWGQLIDHDIGLRNETAGESAPISFSASDPLERFENDFGAISFSRTPAAPGTGTTAPRQQLNTISSFIDASNVFGTTTSRLEWLRQGPVDGDLSDNEAALLLPGGYLPRADARGDATSAPSMDLMGALMGSPSSAVVAGDVRANENIALTAIQTLLAREHNRLVASLPAPLSEQRKFEIARRVVGAESEYITYTQFLPALGVWLPRYRGYDRRVDASISNEFATVGYRAHSMIHGEFEVEADPGSYTAAQISAFRAQGIEVVESADAVKLGIPLAVAFGNPSLLSSVGLGPVLESLAEERQYRNDEQIDDALRSVLFQVPKPGVQDPEACGLPAVSPDCYSGVSDLGAIDVQRGRDHGMPTYNMLRRAYGLRPRASFTQITGEDTDRFPSDPKIDPSDPIDDPDILEFVSLRDADGNLLAPGSGEAAEDAVTGVRRTTLASRLRAIYGSVANLDAFVGMVSESHVRGTEFGELQLAIWKRQFAALRDGDRFFYLNDPALREIDRRYGITYRQPLSQLIALNTGEVVQPNPFFAP